MSAIATLVLRIALIAGFCIDAGVGVLCVFGQPLLGPLLGMPVKDPAITAFLGGELVVASIVYALVFLDRKRWQPLLWLCALDQTLGVLIPAAEMVAGNVPASFQTLWPMPFQLILVAIYIGAARAGRTETPA